MAGSRDLVTNIADIDYGGDHHHSGLLQTRQRHVAFLLDPVIMLFFEHSTMKASVDEVAEQKHMSDSQSEVLILLCRGLGNQEIADRLFYSESMIKKHVSHLMKSFGVHSRLELVNRHGFVATVRLAEPPSQVTR